jgi:membrane protein implicated in regulation of membrane protease activity
MPRLIAILLAVLAVCLLPLFSAGLHILIPLIAGIARLLVSVLVVMWPWGYVSVLAFAAVSLPLLFWSEQRMTARLRAERTKTDRIRAEEERQRDIEDAKNEQMHLERKEWANLHHREALLTDEQRARLAWLEERHVQFARHERELRRKRYAVSASAVEDHIQELERRNGVSPGVRYGERSES